jgi:hypothetical protein
VNPIEPTAAVTAAAMMGQFVIKIGVTTKTVLMFVRCGVAAV